MAEDFHCQNHPDRELTARCARFNRRFRDLDFAPDAADPALCLSAGTYCEYRSQCMVWAKAKRRDREQKKVSRQGAKK